jgi:regulator of protease activity HflC (stomatin/prohibitin superfamily)
MKKIIICMMTILAVNVLGCVREFVPAGYVGIKVNLYGSSKGVDSQELGPGKYWMGINQKLYKFPVFTQNYVWTKDAREGSENNEEITFQTSKGMAVSADIGISYHIKKEMVPKVFQKYRKGVDEITDVYLRNMVRDAFNKFGSTIPVESVYGPGKIEFMNDVENSVKGSVKDIGIEVERLYLIGAMRLPIQVTKSLNAKIEATQKAEQSENELRQTKAEANKKIIAAQGNAKSRLLEAESQAKANEILAKSLTPELINYEIAKMWDGKLPIYYVGDAIPMISIPTPK